MMRMKHFLLILLILSFPANLFPQKDSVKVFTSSAQKNFVREATDVNVTIYPVPVRDNNFTIRSDKEISSIKITNIIGQDIFTVKYNYPQLISKILLENPRRGMYLVVILFSDNTRVVKKVMIEAAN
jgi:hypothetical protein